MSNPTKTTLWTGEFVKLVKSTGYSSYSHGNNYYRPGYVEIQYLSQTDGYSYGLHSLSTKPDKDEQKRFADAGQTWGRLTPEVLAKLIERAQAIDAEVPAKRKARKDAQDAQETARAQAKKANRERFEARVAKALEAKNIIDSLIFTDTVKSGVGEGFAVQLARLANDLLNFRACGGPCGRVLPGNFFGSCCGYDYGHGPTTPSCGKPICGTCIEAGEGLPHDDPKSLFPSSCLYCSQHALEAHEAANAKKKAKVKA